MFSKFFSLNYIYTCYLVAYKGRNKTKEVIEYNQNLEENLFQLRNKLLTFTYKHSSYKTFVVNDSKKRVINAPSFEDHILHHLVFRILEDIFDRKFAENSFANRRGKGSHRAVLKLQKESRKYKYFLKMDITKYFQSVDQGILLKQIKRYVKDARFLHYVKIIIDSYSENGERGLVIRDKINRQSSNSNHQSLKGMPIGNVTSQLFANIYLHDLDFYVEHTIKPKIRKNCRNIFYVRYVDDFVFLGKNKEELSYIRESVLAFLKSELKLSVSSKKLILNKIDCGIPFLGYVIFQNKLKIRNDTIKRFKKRIKNYPYCKKIDSLLSFKGHCDLANEKLIFALSKVVLPQSITNINKYKKNF
jgi:hypothetical protein